jgi:quinol monooxygenase YgiN
MMLSIIKIVPLPGKRKEVLDILLSIKGPTLAVSGCRGSCLCEEQGDENTIIYLEKWVSSEFLYRHICSDIYSRILEAMELSGGTPELFVMEVAKTKGMKLIKEIRNLKR